MIQCPKCKVKYEENNAICPLCYTPNPFKEGVVDVDKADKTKSHTAQVVHDGSLYPQREIRKEKAFEPIHIYTMVSLILIIGAAIINLFTTPKILWSVALLIVGVHGAFTVANTLQYNTSLSVKVFYQLVVASLTQLGIAYLFGYVTIFIEYVLPIIFIACGIVQFALMLYTHNKYRTHYVSTIVIELLTLIPLTITAGIAVEYSLSLACVALAIIMIIVTIAVARGKLYKEFDARFHF